MIIAIKKRRDIIKKLYFNTLESKNAFNLIKTNPVQAKINFEEYLAQYPKDYSMYAYYIYSLVILNESEKAEEILNKVTVLFNSDSHFSNEFSKVEKVKSNIVLGKLRILANQEKYEEFYNFYLEHGYEIPDKNLFAAIFYCQKQLGILNEETKETRDTKTYILRQIIEYQEEDFLDHIQKHLSDYNESAEEANDVVFNIDFPLNQVLEETKKYIPSSKKLCTGFFEDKYIFKLDRCGRVKNKSVDYFTIVCFHNTNKLITMYPSSHCEELPYEDLNYLTYNNTTPKVKKLSQIEKFNKRYNRN